MPTANSFLEISETQPNTSDNEPLEIILDISIKLLQMQLLIFKIRH